MKEVNFSELKSRLDKCTESLNFGMVGGVGHALQSLVPVYSIINDAKKNRAISKYTGRGNAGAKTTIGALTMVPGMVNPALAALTGSEFENLIEAIINNYIMQSGDTSDRKDIRKKIKKILYTNKDPQGMLDNIDLSGLKITDIGYDKTASVH